MYTVSMEKEQL